MVTNITLGQEVAKERWLCAAENVQQISSTIAQRLLATNYEGRGKQDANEFMTDMQLAYMALLYVAEFATDKCRFIPMPDKWQFPTVHDGECHAN